MNKSKEIVSFLQPVELSEEINSFTKLDGILKDLPPYTLLPKDFFDEVMKDFPNEEILNKGAWVVAGVWKGGGSLFLKAMMDDLQINQKLYLYDTFGEIPVNHLKKEKDIKFIEHFELGLQNGNYKKEVEDLFNRFDLSKNVSFIENDIAKLTSSDLPDKISFLHLDLDFYEITLAALNLFYDRVIPGGIIVVDDYFMELFNCKEAVDEFILENNIEKSSQVSKFSSYALKIVKPIN